MARRQAAIRFSPAARVALSGKPGRKAARDAFSPVDAAPSIFMQPDWPQARFGFDPINQT
jgi:hypothetical protein